MTQTIKFQNDCYFLTVKSEGKSGRPIILNLITHLFTWTSNDTWKFVHCTRRNGILLEKL